MSYYIKLHLVLKNSSMYESYDLYGYEVPPMGEVPIEVSKRMADRIVIMASDISDITVQIIGGDDEVIQNTPLAHAQERIKTLQDEKINLESSLSSAQMSLQEANQKADSVVSQNIDLTKQVEELTSKNKQLTNDADCAQQEIDNLNAQIEKLTAEIAALKNPPAPKKTAPKKAADAAKVEIVETTETKDAK